MPKDFDRQYMRRLWTILGLGTALLIAGIVFMAQPNRYEAAYGAPSSRPAVTNPEILRNWIPDSAYAYTLARIDDYLAVNNLKVSALSITNGVNTGADSYDFHLITTPATSLMNVSVAISNFDSTLSTAVSINGTLQTPQQIPTEVRFNGTDGLINGGLTVGQLRAVETALQKYAPDASSITFDTGHIDSTMDPNSGVVTYTVSTSVDQKTYETKITCLDLTSVEVTLTDQNAHKQVFDSGVVNSQS